MRTAKPLVTWWRIVLCGPSATSGATSTPRLIGPGCITIASGLARASRSDVRQNKREYSRTEGNTWLVIRSF